MAFTRYLTESWHAVRSLAFSRMKARYRRTLAGFLWVVASPIITFGVQALVFKKVLRIDIPGYPIFLMGGLLPWTFLASTLESGIPMLVNSRELLTAFKIEPFILIFSSLLDNWINFIFAFLLVLVPASFFHGIDVRGLLLLPFAVLPLLLGVAGLLWFLAVFNVFYRDVRFVTGFLVHILFYLTPLFYPIEFIPENIRWMVKLNPLYFLVRPVRDSIYFFSGPRFFASLAEGLLVAIGLLVLSLLYWKKNRNDLYYFI